MNDLDKKLAERLHLDQVAYKAFMAHMDAREELTETELRVCADIGMAPEVYTRHKRQIRGRREAWDKKLEDAGLAPPAAPKHAPGE